MLSSRLEAVFEEFLNKVKEEFKVAKKGEVEHKKLKKLPNTTNYGQEEKPSLLDNHPSFMFKKRNLLPGWYSPMQSRSIELKTRYPKKFNKPDKNHTSAPYAEGRNDNLNHLNKRKNEIRKRDHATPPINLEPNMKRCICKHHKTEAEHLYDNPTKTRISRNHQNFRADGVNAMRSQLRPGHQSKKMPTMSAFTLTSVSSNSSSPEYL